MKFKLSYKIFVAFTLTSLMVVALMVGIIRFYVARNFADFVNKSLLERYSDVAVALATEYQTQKGWRTLKNNPDRWEKILRSNLPQRIFDLRRPPPRLPDIENKGSGGGVALKTSRRQRLPGVFSDWRAGWRFLMLINSISSADVPRFHMTATPCRKLPSPANPQAGWAFTKENIWLTRWRLDS
jgi:hypothetical protein